MNDKINIFTTPREIIKELRQELQRKDNIINDLKSSIADYQEAVGDYQDELKRKDNIINELKVYSQMNINATCNMNNDNYNEGRYKAYCDILDKIKELEEK